MTSWPENIAKESKYKDPTEFEDSANVLHYPNKKQNIVDKELILVKRIDQPMGNPKLHTGNKEYVEELILLKRMGNPQLHTGNEEYVEVGPRPIKDCFDFSLEFFSKWNHQGKKGLDGRTVDTDYQRTETIKIPIPFSTSEFLEEHLDCKKFAEKLSGSFFRIANPVIMVFEFFRMYAEFEDEINETIDDAKKIDLTIPSWRECRELVLRWPNLELELSWRASVNDKQLPQTSIYAVAKGLFMGGDLIIDIYKLAHKIPQVRLFLTALDIVMYITDSEFVFDFTLSGDFGFDGRVWYNKTNAPYSDSADDVADYETWKTATDSDLRITGEIKGLLKMEVSTTLKENFRLTGGPAKNTAGVHLDTGVKGVCTIVPKNDQVQWDCLFWFTGILFKAYTKKGVEADGAGKKDTGLGEQKWLFDPCQIWPKVPKTDKVQEEPVPAPADDLIPINK